MKKRKNIIIFAIIFAIFIAAGITVNAFVLGNSDSDGQSEAAEVSNEEAGEKTTVEFDAVAALLDSKTFDASNKTVTVISQNRLDEYRKNAADGRAVKLSLKDLQAIVKDSIELYKNYDKFILTGYGDKETVEINKIADNSITASDELYQIVDDVYAIFQYRLESLNSDEFYRTSQDVLKEKLLIFSSVLHDYKKYYVVDCINVREAETVFEAIYNNFDNPNREQEKTGSYILYIPFINCADFYDDDGNCITLINSDLIKEEFGFETVNGEIVKKQSEN